jgi:hypothetical protein
VVRRVQHRPAAPLLSQAENSQVYGLYRHISENTLYFLITSQHVMRSNGQYREVAMLIRAHSCTHARYRRQSVGSRVGCRVQVYRLHLHTKLFCTQTRNSPKHLPLIQRSVFHFHVKHTNYVTNTHTKSRKVLHRLAHGILLQLPTVWHQ